MHTIISIAKCMQSTGANTFSRWEWPVHSGAYMSPGPKIELKYTTSGKTFRVRILANYGLLLKMQAFKFST